MVYDSMRQRILLFGGAGDGYRTDTWEWDGESWTLRATDGPSPRVYQAMAYDAQRARAVLFGGAIWNGSSYTNLSDTWEWDGSTWMLRATSGPTGRQGHAMAYDAARNRVVLYGGYDGDFKSDMWEWDGSSWTQRIVSGLRPGARSSHEMAYDADRQRIVLFGAFPAAYPYETWEWDGSGWTRFEVAGPGPRSLHSMTYDSSRRRVVLFGGHGWDDHQQDTWEWDG